jgi:hypothetical protein
MRFSNCHFTPGDAHGAWDKRLHHRERNSVGFNRSSSQRHDDDWLAEGARDNSCAAEPSNLLLLAVGALGLVGLALKKTSA